MTRKPKPREYQKDRNLVDEVDNNPKILEIIKENIYCEEGVLEELDRLNTMHSKNPEYEKLYQKLIQVGEYDNN